MKRIISTLFGLAILCLFAEAQAVPTTVSFTGRLSTSTGPVSGAVSVTFSFFNQATNGTVMWTETRSLTATSTGLVYADLGAMTTLDESVLGNAPLFLEIQVGSEVLTPRLPLQSVPYAIRSHVANEADTLGGTVTADEVVTAATAPIAITTGTASLTTCGANQIYKMVGGNWQCSADVDTNTLYTAGANGGLALNGTAFGLTTCTTGQVLKSTGAGTWGCAADTDTTTTYSATANGGLTFNGTQIGLMTCTTGQVLKATGAGTWGCAADIDTDTNTTYSATANGGLTFNGTQIGLMTCTTGQVLKAGATAGTWVCATDSVNAGTITGITTATGSSGLDGGCTTGACALVVDPTDFHGTGPLDLTVDTVSDFVTVSGTYLTLNPVTVTAPTSFGGQALLIASVQARCGSSTGCPAGSSVVGTVGWATTSGGAPLSGSDHQWGSQQADNDWVQITSMTVVNLAPGASTTYYLVGNCGGAGGCEYDQMQTAAIFLPN